ncbi:MAG TPA: hypothetical protein VHO70_05955 [Chitinispirillaceae bacterium]|nr:hypothetical protein [Chitinispirillaceae bacterium]
MRIQSVSAYSFMYNSQSSGNASNEENCSTAAANRTAGSSYRYYDILDLSDIDLGEDNTLDAQDVEKALQTPKSKCTRNIRASMKSVSAQRPKISGFDTPFLKNSPDEFITQAAKLLAAYLNPEMSGGDKVFAYAGTDFESAFGQFVKDQSTQYANELALFFSESGHPTNEEVNKFVNEISDVIKEYGTQLAAGKDIGIEDLTSKLHINGVDITIGELDKAVSTINEINSPVMSLDSHADFAVAGLGVAKMKAFTTSSFSKPVADMLMKTYNKKVSEEIDENDTEIEQSRKKEQKNSFIERYLNGDSPLIKSKKDTNSSEDPYFKLDTQFKGSAKEEIFNLFSNINSSDIDESNADYEKAVVNFQMIMKKWEHNRGYALHSDDIRSNSLKLSAAFDQLDDYIGLRLKKETES